MKQYTDAAMKTLKSLAQKKLKTKQKEIFRNHDNILLKTVVKTK